MKCPLLAGVWRSGEKSALYGVRDCLREECAWWSQGWNMCAVLSLMDDAMRIANSLQDIREKMPTANQFTK